MMVPVLLASPLAVNWLLTVTIPWLVGSTVVGALAGRLSAENINNRDEIERQQAELNRLAAENQALAAHVKTLQVASSQEAVNRRAVGARARKRAPDSIRTSFLKGILETNLKLRKDLNTRENNRG
jgi:cell division protein FtsB